MENKIIETSELPLGQKVYLKHDAFGWRVVEPWKNPETGKINWFNFCFGGKRALLMLIVVLVILALIYFGVNEMISNYKVIAEAPCQFCKDCFTGATTFSNYTLIG